MHQPMHIVVHSFRKQKTHLTPSKKKDKQMPLFQDYSCNLLLKFHPFLAKNSMMADILFDLWVFFLLQQRPHLHRSWDSCFVNTISFLLSQIAQDMVHAPTKILYQGFLSTPSTQSLKIWSILTGGKLKETCPTLQMYLGTYGSQRRDVVWTHQDCKNDVALAVKLLDDHNVLLKLIFSQILKIISYLMFF
jgi:hypothetical protein